MATQFDEHPIAFSCRQETLIGVVARPAQPARQGVLIVVGGPQYRAGSHRQFVLLARYLASHGIAAMRFDYRGMGDSTGPLRNFEHINDDIRAAIDQFVATVSELQDVFLWGLCDAATASSYYAHADPRVRGVILLNPWVRTSEGEARTYLKHYYLRRAFDPDFWSKAASGRFDIKTSMAGLTKLIRQSVSSKSSDSAADGATGVVQTESLAQRMATELERFPGRVMLILSGNDLTAREFADTTGADSRWRRLLAAPNVTRVQLADANHTFSSRAWRDQVADATRAWIVNA